MIILKITMLFLPWSLRRLLLNKFFGYQIHPSAKIGLAWIYPRKLIMNEKAKIDHFSIAIHLDLVFMEKNSYISRGNWITGMSNHANTNHFEHQKDDRKAELILGESAAITKNHHLDCTNKIIIGKFSTIAGYNSQLLTHSIDLIENRQNSNPIIIGNYTFIGTNVVILGGSELPSYSVLAAKSLLNKKYYEEWKVYGGVPAKEISSISEDAKYFSRTVGFVV